MVAYLGQQCERLNELPHYVLLPPQHTYMRMWKLDEAGTSGGRERQGTVLQGDQEENM